MTIPGIRLRRWAGRFLDADTLERLIDPTIADMQWEHEQALRTGSTWRRHRVLFDGYIALAKVLAVHGARRGWRAGLSVLTEDDAAIRRVLIFAAGWISILTLAAVVPPYASMGRRAAGDYADEVWLLLLLAPQGLALAMPIGFFFGALGGLRARANRRLPLQRTVATSVVCAALTLGVALWLVPAANQAFRVFVTRQVAGNVSVSVPKGPNEMTPGEVRARIETLKGRPDSAREISRLRWSYHVRSALGIAPIVLALFACGLAVTARGRLTLLVDGAAMAIMCLWTGLVLSARLEDNVTLAWLPNLLLGLTGLLLLRRSARAGPLT